MSVANISPITAILDGPYTSSPLLSLRTVPESFEATTVKGWLQKCIETAGEGEAADTEPLFDFRCIDVLKECVLM
jgi:hypothetical protein